MDLKAQSDARTPLTWRTVKLTPWWEKLGVDSEREGKELLKEHRRSDKNQPLLRDNAELTAETPHFKLSFRTGTDWVDETYEIFGGHLKKEFWEENLPRGVPINMIFHGPESLTEDQLDYLSSPKFLLSRSTRSGSYFSLSSERMFEHLLEGGRFEYNQHKNLRGNGPAKKIITGLIEFSNNIFGDIIFTGEGIESKSVRDSMAYFRDRLTMAYGKAMADCPGISLSRLNRGT